MQDIAAIGARTISFTIYGEAKPAGSKRAFAIRRNGVPTGRIAVTDANPKSREWKNLVSDAARQAYQGPLLTGPLKVTFQFYRTRPKGHFGGNGLNKKGRDSIAPTTKPDCLKLARCVEDALSKVIYADDSQIVVELITKEYGEPARCDVTIEAIQF